MFHFLPVSSKSSFAMLWSGLRRRLQMPFQAAYIISPLVKPSRPRLFSILSGSQAVEQMRRRPSATTSSAYFASSWNVVPHIPSSSVPFLVLVPQRRFSESQPQAQRRYSIERCLAFRYLLEVRYRGIPALH